MLLWAAYDQPFTPVALTGRSLDLCQLFSVVPLPLDTVVSLSEVAFPIPLVVLPSTSQLYWIVAIRSQQEHLADPVSLLKINWVLLNAILNKLLVKLLAVLQEASDFMGNQSTQYSWPNPLSVEETSLLSYCLLNCIYRKQACLKKEDFNYKVCKLYNPELVFKDQMFLIGFFLCSYLQSFQSCLSLVLARNAVAGYKHLVCPTF